MACGSAYYYTGLYCLHGHLAPRNVVRGSCEVCRKEQRKDYKRKDAEHRRAGMKRWYQRYRLLRKLRMYQHRWSISPETYAHESA
jgi:hypothetical protein